MSLALLVSPDRANAIKEISTTLDLNIVHTRSKSSIDFETELEELARVPVSILIIDLSCCDDAEDEKNLLKALRSYRIKRENTRIILITENRIQGDVTMGGMFKLGIWDIVNLFPDDNFLQMIEKAITDPAGYARAVRWDTENVEVSAAPKDDSSAKKIVKEKYIEIETEKIIGKPVIAVAGTIEDIGVTHTCISIASYLSKLKFRPAVLEAWESNDFSSIKKCYSDATETADGFELGGTFFIPYKEQHDIIRVLDSCDYLILDLGLIAGLSDTYMHEFLRASVRLVLSGTKPWEEKAFVEHIRNADYLNKCNYLFSFSNDAGVAHVKNSFKTLSAYKAEYNPDPFKPDKAASSLYEQLLKEILPAARTKQKFSPDVILSGIRSKAEAGVCVIKELAAK